MRVIIYVDGAVGVGKSTFIKVLAEVFRLTLDIKNENRKSAHRHNVEVLPEPLHRDWTSDIISGLGKYRKLLQFLLTRKCVAIEKWSVNIASDGLQELEDNVLIVERSIPGDRRVNGGYENAFTHIKAHYPGAKEYYILIKKSSGDDFREQNRLSVLYNDLRRSGLSAEIVDRPEHISSYFEMAASTVNTILNT